MKKTKITLILLFIFSLFSPLAFAQDIKIELGPDEIALNETFNIKVTVSDEKIKSYGSFPEIPGFQKQGLSQSSSMNVINGQMSSTNSIIQYYKPLRKGQFILGNFSMNINGNVASSEGKEISVMDTRQNSRGGRSNDPFDDFFGGSGEEPEFVEVEDEAFFSLSLDKEEVYVGEGFHVSLAFYMPEDNQAPFNFHEPGRQLESIIQKIKPTNAWEENFNITNIQPEKVSLNGKNWTRFKVYESVFYPFSEGAIDIPSVPWKMIKYKIAKDPTFFGNNRQEDFKTFYSSPKSISIKPLPPHPLKNEVSVGVYELRENFDQKEIATGEGVTYNFGIMGEGNINSIQPPKKTEEQKLNSFDPNERQQINRGYGRVTGVKEYNYYLTINEPGRVELKDHFEWIFFNPSLEKYDTLRPEAVLNVAGENKVNQAISSSRLGGIYDLIEVEDNNLLNQRFKYYFSAFINVLLVATVILLGILMIKKR
ncbi:MAG: BatD family protein [Anditalea sp.]